MSDTSVSIELVKKLAKSARLYLTEDEAEKYAQQLAVILDAFKELDKVDTEVVAPSYHPIEMEDSLREDVPEKWDWDPLSNVSDKEDRSIRGPKIK